MKFSIVIPSFNQDKFVGQTLESILSQKGDFFIECIVFDGGSTDKTVDILKNYDLKIKNKEFDEFNNGVTLYWQSQRDKGQSDAINKGLRKASGDIIAYLNSDDTYLNGAFQKIADAFNQNRGQEWLTGYCNIIDQDNNPIRSIIASYKNFWLRHYSYRKLLVLNFISQPATFWRLSTIKKCGVFDETLHYAMDYDYWLRIGKKNNPVILQTGLANFRIHGASKGETAFKKQFTEDFTICQKNTPSYLLKLLHRLHNFLIISIYRTIK